MKKSRLSTATLKALERKKKQSLVPAVPTATTVPIVPTATTSHVKKPDYKRNTLPTTTANTLKREAINKKRAQNKVEETKLKYTKPRLFHKTAPQASSGNDKITVSNVARKPTKIRPPTTSGIKFQRQSHVKQKSRNL